MRASKMTISKITIVAILALLSFVAFGTVPIQSGYAQGPSSQTNILVGPNAEVFGFADKD
jgi:hypothetical protein